MDKKEFRKNLFRWIVLLPGALLSGVLATFPLHWVLSLKSSYNGTFLGFIELSPEAFVAIERALTPFVIAIIFVLVGAKIAPTNKFKTAVALSVIYIIFAIGIIFFATTSSLQISLDLRSAGPILGLLLGLYIVWRESKNSNDQIEWKK